MCGIAGLLFPNGSEENAERRARLLQTALLHRGPDGRGQYIEKSAMLVHTRLALVGLESGAQPMHSQCGRYVLVFNGEIYNSPELRQRLTGYCFTTDSDTETLLASLLQWGEDALPRLEGMFAFALWDRETKEALLARDALGVKPLVYGQAGGEFVFASEAKAILASGWKRELDEEVLCEYLIAPALSGVRSSLLAGLQHLQAGHCMRVTSRGAEPSRAWFRYSIASEPSYSRESLSDSLRDQLQKSVELSMRADVPVGVFLSGGLDSTLLAAMCTKDKEESTAAFTLRYEDAESIRYEDSSIVIANDLPFAELAAAELCMPLQYADVASAQVMSTLKDLAFANDRIPAWEQEIGQNALARQVRGKRKAVLVGDAADETHFGYYFLLNQRVSNSPNAFMERFGASERERCLSERLRAQAPLRRLDSEYRTLAADAGTSFDHGDQEAQRATTALIVTLWLGRLLHNGDIHTMAQGVEARVPFANMGVLRVAQEVCASQGLANNVEKAILRKVAASMVSESVLARKKSALPVEARLGRSYQQELRRLLALESDFAHHVFDVPHVLKLCSADRVDETLRSQLFTMLAALHWKRAHLGAAVD